jgi:hemerythrin-like domain-containing protein
VHQGTQRRRIRFFHEHGLGVFALFRAKSLRRIRDVGMTGPTDPAGSPGDIVALLVQDHARMETRLAALVESMNALGRGGDVDLHFGLVADTLDFFATEGGVHESLEETLLFPCIRALPQFGQILSALEFQHRMNRVEAEALRGCVDRRAAGTELRRISVRFVEMHRGHVVAEERALFPLLPSALAPKVLEEIDVEARKRVKAWKNGGR